MIDDVYSLSEEDIKLRYITPAITKQGWSVTDISMEAKVKLTDGKINLRGNLVARGKAKYADYLLYYNRATPIAIVEAKDANHSVCQAAFSRPIPASPPTFSSSTTRRQRAQQKDSARRTPGSIVWICQRATSTSLRPSPCSLTIASR